MIGDGFCLSYMTMPKRKIKKIVLIWLQAHISKMLGKKNLLLAKFKSDVRNTKCMGFSHSFGPSIKITFVR